jgi:hypothetical protein
VFEDRLRIKLQVITASATVDVVGSAVAELDLTLEPGGFGGRVRFWRFADNEADTLMAAVTGVERIDVRLEIEQSLPLTAVPPDPLSITGYVEYRTVRETSFRDVSDNPVHVREYTFTFRDAAAALWANHRPSLLEVDAKMADVVASQVVPGIDIELEVAAAKVSHPHICIPLGLPLAERAGLRHEAGHHFRETGTDSAAGPQRALFGSGAAATSRRRTRGLAAHPASFYDFVVWWGHAHAAGLRFDYVGGTYALTASKPMGAAKIISVDEIEAIHTLFAPTPRWKPRLVNGSALSAAVTPGEATSAVTGLFADAVRIEAQPAAAQAVLDDLNAQRFEPLPVLVVDWAMFPQVPWWPGCMVNPARGHKSQLAAASLGPWRVHTVSMKLSSLADTPEEDRDTDSRGYRAELRTHCEAAAELRPWVPPHTAPVYPVLAEANVLCDGGDPGDRIYAFHEDTETGELYYRARAAPWNAVVRPPHEPLFAPGHWYAPLTKDSRVVLSLTLHRTRIEKILEWAADTKLAMDTQGNSWMLGKNAKSETAIRHTYASDIPQLTVVRSSLGDFERIELLEGILLLETKEDPSQVPAAVTLNLSAEVAVAQAQLLGNAAKAQAETEAALSEALGGLQTQLDASTAQLESALGGAIGALEAKTKDADSRLTAALTGLGAEAKRLDGVVTGAVSELQAAAKL